METVLITLATLAGVTLVGFGIWKMLIGGVKDFGRSYCDGERH